MDLDEARGREQLARQIAFGSDSTPEQARTMLKAAPQNRPGLLNGAQHALMRSALKGAGISDRVSGSIQPWGPKAASSS